MKKILALAMTVVVCAFLTSCGTPSPAVQYMKQGNEKYNAGDYKGALEFYNEGIAADPQNPYAYNNRALAEDKLGDYQDAIRDYEKVIEINPSFKNKIQPEIDKIKAKMK